jgi:hypothetical protein
MNFWSITKISFKTIIFLTFLIFLHICVYWAIRSESSGFQRIVLMLSIVLYNFLIVLFWYTVTYSAPQTWPPVVSRCPDYFQDKTAYGASVATCVDSLGLMRTAGSTPANPKTVTIPAIDNCGRYQWSVQNNVYWDGISNLVKPC